MGTRASQSPELSVADRLQDEIAKLRAQVESLKNDVKLQTATLMTADSTRQILQSQTIGGQRSVASDAPKQKLLAQFEEQSAHKQQCLYRACATITTFKINDPDPNAVDGGNVLGLRFEVMSKSKFLRPYYVMLNRPYTNRRYLRVHRHTIPQCIPLSGLVARYLPLPAAKDDDNGDAGPKKQDLSRFARTLRRELVRYHNRVAVISDMKKAAGLGSKKSPNQGSETQILDIGVADAEAKQISIQWRDGRSGRLIMNDDGDVVKMVVQGDQGQDREAVRQFLGGAVRIEEVTRRLETP
ncbi:putative cenp-O kinetochore centromere component [Rosellinia necatrix]|uniref:Putative cenp-O kinetochore centromere component n=1 Tax=Rosellinia necatrix TaxID=77044 RepID=A0A1W2TWH1_ROSNE|nr:putative cenp-O kinetochore centromere component [Rosellinia necatrix]